MSGNALIYLVEELGDARLRCAQLKRQISEATKLIAGSSHRDHFFEVAGHLIEGIPENLFKLEKALQATAMAASRLDYEEIKQELRPEKAIELEQVLKDVRIQFLSRHSGEVSMKPSAVVKQIRSIASRLRESHNVEEAQSALVSLMAGMGQPKLASATDVAANLDGLATKIASAKEPSRAQTQAELFTVISQVAKLSGSREDVMDGFMKANPNMSKEDAEKAADMWEKNKDVVKEKTAAASSPQEMRHPSGWVLKWDPKRPDRMDVNDEGNTGWSDEAVLERGRILYDSPERIPSSVKEAVAKFFRKVQRMVDPGKVFRFPEGLMTEREWVERFADRVEEAHGKYLAWKGDNFQNITKATYLWAKQQGVKTAAALPTGEEEVVSITMTMKAGMVAGFRVNTPMGQHYSKTLDAALHDAVKLAPHAVENIQHRGTVVPKLASEKILLKLAAIAQEAATAIEALKASSKEEVMEGFKKQNPSLTDEQLKEIGDHWEQNKDVVKDKNDDHGKQSFGDGHASDDKQSFGDGHASVMSRSASRALNALDAAHDHINKLFHLEMPKVKYDLEKCEVLLQAVESQYKGIVPNFADAFPAMVRLRKALGEVNNSIRRISDKDVTTTLLDLTEQYEWWEEHDLDMSAIEKTASVDPWEVDAPVDPVVEGDPWEVDAPVVEDVLVAQDPWEVDAPAEDSAVDPWEV